MYRYSDHCALQPTALCIYVWLFLGRACAMDVRRHRLFRRRAEPLSWLPGQKTVRLGHQPAHAQWRRPAGVILHDARLPHQATGGRLLCATHHWCEVHQDASSGMCSMWLALRAGLRMENWKYMYKILTSSISPPARLGYFLQEKNWVASWLFCLLNIAMAIK